MHFSLLRPGLTDSGQKFYHVHRPLMREYQDLLYVTGRAAC